MNTEQMKMYEPIVEPVYFQVDEKIKLMYDYNKLSIFQVEGAIEVLQFMQDQKAVIDNGAQTDFNSKIASGGYKWRTDVLAFLLLELDAEEKPKSFSEATFKRNRDKIDSLPLIAKSEDVEIDNFKNVMACIDDFFFKQGLMPNLLKTLQQSESQSLEQKLQKISQIAKIYEIFQGIPSKTESQEVTKLGNLPED